MTIGRDENWDLTDLEEIVAIARTHVEACSAAGEEQMRACAAQAVRSHVHFGASDKENAIVEALIDEVLRIIRRGA